MKVIGLGWMGTKTRQFDRMNRFYRDVLGLEVLSVVDKSGRFKLCAQPIACRRNRAHVSRAAARVRQDMAAFQGAGWKCLRDYWP